MNISTNGAASINVSVELNGTVYTGGSLAVFPHARHFCLHWLQSNLDLNYSCTFMQGNLTF